MRIKTVYQGEKLYRVVSTAQAPFLKGQPSPFVIHWYVHSRFQPPLPYPSVIEHYSSAHPYALYAENLVEECFTKSEAEAFIHYFSGFPNFTTDLREVGMPIPLRPHLGFADLRLDKGCFRHHIFQNADYRLPFRVSGYCDGRYLVEHDLPLEKIVLFPGQ